MNSLMAIREEAEQGKFERGKKGTYVSTAGTIIAHNRVAVWSLYGKACQAHMT